jgi:hypothetical protein
MMGKHHDMAKSSEYLLRFLDNVFEELGQPLKTTKREPLSEQERKELQQQINQEASE